MTEIVRLTETITTNDTFTFDAGANKAYNPVVITTNIPLPRLTHFSLSAADPWYSFYTPQLPQTPISLSSLTRTGVQRSITLSPTSILVIFRFLDPGVRIELIIGIQRSSTPIVVPAGSYYLYYNSSQSSVNPGPFPVELRFYTSSSESSLLFDLDIDTIPSSTGSTTLSDYITVAPSFIDLDFS